MNKGEKRVNMHSTHAKAEAQTGELWAILPT